LRRRNTWLALIAAAYALVIACVCFPFKSHIDAFSFGLLQGLLLHYCFRWFKHPVYGGAFNYVSPLAIFNSLSFLYYGIGNIPEYLFPDLIYSHNQGAERFYIPVLAVAVASSFGVDLLYRYISRILNESKDHYPSSATLKEFEAAPGAAGVMSVFGVIAMALMLYCASNYEFTGVVDQIAAKNEIDNILLMSYRGLSGVAAVAFAYLYFRKPTAGKAVLCLVLLGMLAPLVLILGSRSALCSIVLCLYLVVMLFQGTIKRAQLILMFIVLAAVWVAGRAVKDSRNLMSEQNTVSAASLSSRIAESSSLDLGYRMAGLDFTAALWEEQVENGQPPMLGKEALYSVLVAVPHILWPSKEVTDPKQLVYDAYSLYAVKDQIMTPLPSAFADGSWLGAPFLMAAFGGILCALQHFILRAQYGMLIYLSSLSCLFTLETTGVDYLLLYTRFALLAWVALSLIDGIRICSDIALSSKRRKAY
jgi:hypothetical protein